MRSVDSVLAYALIAFVGLWRTWAVLQWTFRQDDWIWVSNASRAPFLRFVTTQINGHLLPGGLSLLWAATRIAPLSFGTIEAPLLIVSVIGGVLMWRFLRALFGDRPANLIPLAVFLLCPLSVPPALWLASSLCVIPLQVFVVGTLFAVLRYVRAPSTERLLVVGLVWVGALLWWQKSLLILPLVALFALLYLGDGSGRARLRSVAIGRWRLWAVFGGITIPYLFWYRSVAVWELTYRPTLTQVGRLAKSVVGSTVIPTYLGGPWSASLFPVTVLHELPPSRRFLTWVVAAAIVGVSLVFRRQAWRAWLLLGLYVGLDLALVATSRLALFGLQAGLTARYIADSVPLLALALALAFMVPLERRRDPAWARRVFALDRGPGGEALAGDATLVDRRRRTPGPLLASRRFAVGVVLVYASSALLTGSRIAILGRKDSAKDWLATASSQLALHPTASIVDTHVPPEAISPLFPDAANASRALAPIAPRVRWNAPSESMLIFDPTGRLRPAAVGRVTSAKPGPVFGCGYLVNGGAVVAPLRLPLFSWVWGVRLSYDANGSAIGFVTVDGDHQLVRFLPGHHTLTLVHAGPARTVTIEDAGSRVCVGDLWLGPIAPSLPGQA